MSRKIFISYRRSDAGALAGRIADTLQADFGTSNVFYDHESILAGAQFPDSIRRALVESTVVLVLIGRNWLASADDAGRRRLDIEEDFVRIEIATALACPNVMIVPVLLEGAAMPSAGELPAALQPFAAHQAALPIANATFSRDVAALSSALQEAIWARLDMADRIKHVLRLTPVWSVVLAAAIIAPLAIPGLRELALSAPGISHAVQAYHCTYPGEAMASDKLNVVVASLRDEGAGYGESTRVKDALVQQFDVNSVDSAIRVVQTRCQVSEAAIKDARLAHQDAQQRGKSLLTALNGDILIWGKVLTDADMRRKSLRLYFLPRQSDARHRAILYQVTEALDLPANFGQDLGSVVAGLIALTARPAFIGDKYAVKVLEPQLRIIAQLNKEPPTAFTTEMRALVKEALGIIEFRIGEESRSAVALKRAEAIWRELINSWSDMGKEVERGRAMTALGLTLHSLSELNGSSATRQDSVGAYQQALATLKPLPGAGLLEWSKATLGLGDILHVQGDKSADVGPMRQAEQVLRQGVKVLREHRELLPNDLGRNLVALADLLLSIHVYDTDKKLLEEAISFGKEGSELLKKTDAHRDLAWAYTTLANAYRSLGETSENEQDLLLAIANFEKAGRVLQDRRSIEWVRVMVGEADSYKTLAERAIGLDDALKHLKTAAEMLEGAIQHEALKRPEESDEMARTMQSLGETWRVLGIKQREKPYLTKAAAMLEQSAKLLDTPPEASVSVDWIAAIQSRADTLLAMSELDGDRPALDEALAIYQRVIDRLDAAQGSDKRVMDRFMALSGWSRTLFELGKVTNSGFVAVRARAIAHKAMELAQANGLTAQKSSIADLIRKIDDFAAAQPQ